MDKLVRQASLRMLRDVIPDALLRVPAADERLEAARSLAAQRSPYSILMAGRGSAHCSSNRKAQTLLPLPLKYLRSDLRQLRR